MSHTPVLLLYVTLSLGELLGLRPKFAAQGLRIRHVSAGNAHSQGEKGPYSTGDLQDRMLSVLRHLAILAPPRRPYLVLTSQV